MHLKLLTPQKTFYNGEATSVVIPGRDGYVGFLDNHVPFVTLLKSGIVELVTEKGLLLFGVAGGSFEFSPAGLFLLAEVAWAPEDINAVGAADDLKKAEANLAAAGEADDLGSLAAAVERANVRVELLKRITPG
jgi:F-type H+-transporting ATPase subunit epsilon